MSRGGIDQPGNAIVLEADNAEDRRRLAELRSDPGIEFVDRYAEQEAALRQLRPTPDAELFAEGRRWVHYPWRRSVVAVLGPRSYRRLRLDRNRNLITGDEQDRLGALRIGVVGLSVGHVIAHTLTAQGLCGQLRLADFDSLELSNLNRVPATVFDLGLNKAAVAARRIAEVDPYLDVRVLPDGLTSETITDFLDGLDIVVEECDSLDVKALVRDEARRRRLPVLMATSDRGLVDVERFDLEPDRPIFHGLLGDLSPADLAGLTNQQKVHHVLRMIDATSLSARGAASLVEVGHTLSTWPQLAGDVALGATAVAEAVRKIGLGEALSSGRTRIDVGTALDGLYEPTLDRHEEWHQPDDPTELEREPASGVTEALEAIDAIAAAAMRAPSGGNVQPWSIQARPDAVVIGLVSGHQSFMDVECRGSAVAVGAAVFNARAAAAAHGVLGPVEFDDVDGEHPLRATIQLADGDDPQLAGLYRPILHRETNRHHGTPPLLDATITGALESAAQQQGAQLRLITGSDDIDCAAQIFADADRIRYLTPHLHADMTSELSWPGEDSLESGIDVRSLELDPGQLLTLDILCRPAVMSLLAQWDAGAALGADTSARVSSSGTLAVVTVAGRSLLDYARGGSAVEAVWATAQEHGLAVQPVSPVFLYGHTDEEMCTLSPAYADRLRLLQTEFRELAQITPNEAEVLVLRLSDAPPTSVRSRRRDGSRLRPPAGRRYSDSRCPS